VSDLNPKPINAWPLIALLGIVIFLIYWVYGGLAQ
jgi:hypothetical protein